MKKLSLCVVALTWPTVVFASAPVETVATPTMGETALLALIVTLPLAGAIAMHRRISRHRGAQPPRG